MHDDHSLELDAPIEGRDVGHFAPGTPKRMLEFSEDLRHGDALDQAPEGFTRNFAYEKTEGVREVLDLVRSGRSLIFVSGRAGTGKSRLISYLNGLPCAGMQLVVAPTGVAALSLNASTIHAAFRLPVGVLDVSSLKSDPALEHSVLRHVGRLVIDEISMVRADILDAVDVRLRQVRRVDLPFGGVQVVVVGDFLQLPPVVTDAYRDILERLGYPTPFAFSARVMRKLPIHVATLRKVWRQSDPEMVAALGAIREGRGVENALEWINAHCARPHRNGVEPLMLVSTRERADWYNEQGLAELHQNGREPLMTFRAVSSGGFDHLGAVEPAPRELTLRSGARVMAVKNERSGRYVNGSLGTVVDAFDGDGQLDRTYVQVRFDGAREPIVVRPVEWEMKRQVWREDLARPESQPIGAYWQLPLVLGYAITIHKSQGLSLDDVRIDLGSGAFAPGQLYVALSRARTAEGLSLVRPLEERDVQVDEMMLQFLEWAGTADNLSFALATQ